MSNRTAAFLASKGLATSEKNAKKVVIRSPELAPVTQAMQKEMSAVVRSAGPLHRDYPIIKVDF